MSLLDILRLARTEPVTLPAFIREVRDIQGVRVIRLQGPVGREIGRDAAAADEAASAEGAFVHPLLFDFRGTSGWDFSTVSYLVQSLRRRMAEGGRNIQVGIVNAPPRLLAELEIAKLDGLFRIFKTDEEAFAALAN